MRVPAPLFIPSPPTALLFKNPNLPLFGHLSGLELTTELIQHRSLDPTAQLCTWF